MKTIHFETLGCKLNQVESEGAARAFADAGFAVTMESLSAKDAGSDDVSLCVINTCTVTAKAEQKARRIIRMLLLKFPQAAVCVTGCYAQVEAAFIRRMDSRICVLGGQHKGVIADVPSLMLREPDLCGEKLAEKLQAFFDEKSRGSTPAFKLATDTFSFHSRSSLKIQDGCNNVCTYCRIRLARGKSVSLPVEEAIAQVQALEKAGQSEVVLTTVNIAQYRSPWKDGYADFAELLRQLLSATEHIFFRISSLYPEIVDERLCEVIANPRVQSHFHISVQSGSDAVLARMKRPYRIATVYKAVELLRKTKDRPFLACDVIAGFPGETEEDFALTKKMCEECGFTWVHAFPFSPRPGTEAYTMRPMVANNITSDRVAWLEAFSKKSREAYISSFAGETVSAVCETVHRQRLVRDRLIVHAVTQNFLHCQIVFPPDSQNIPRAGSVVQVKIRRPLTDAERTGESDTLAELA
ncbi:MAG: tRNA (N(6)-L-threonylcarbamoyladenosine(37)-C(2))-methylthiotransferase MtaB [Treponema sp.]|nr:tRNA (N(6)-L-threonylcarbamoyladenosine(37)-C(2))-methylthiotransferase MtaB [Treponema sp.]